MAKSPEETEEVIMANIVKKTGRSLEEWIDFLKRFGFAGTNEQLELLKTNYGLDHFQINLIIKRMRGPATPAVALKEEGGSIESIFKGVNAPVKLLFDDLLREVKKFGRDVIVKSSRGMVSFIRAKQFLLVKPAGGTLFLGFAFNMLPPTPLKLTDATGLGGPERIKYQLALDVTGDITPEVIYLVRKAYEQN